MALGFSKYIGTVSFSTVSAIGRQMAAHFWTDLTPFGLGLLFWGLGALVWNREKIPDFLWIGLGWGLLEALFVFTIPFPTFESHQILLGWVFAGFPAALALVGVRGIIAKRGFRWVWVDLLMGAFFLAQLSQVGHLLDRKKEKGAEDYARNVLTLMAPDALFVPSEENEFFPVAAFQQSFGFREDVALLEPGIDPSRVAPQIRRCLDQNRPLYVTRKWALPPGWGFQALGPLLKVVRSSPAAAPRKAPSLKPLAVWGGIELQGVDIAPSVVRPGQMVELHYRWVRRKSSAQDSSDMVVGLFINPQGKYWVKHDVFWLHDIHEPPMGYFTAMKRGCLYEEKRILFVPSDFPPGDYALAVGLQKKLPPLEEGRELFNHEFYERNSYQDLDKFQGRGENGAIVQFAASDSQSWLEGLWPLTRTLYPIADPRFVPAAQISIQAGN